MNNNHFPVMLNEIKSFIPNSVKYYVKNTIFIIPSLKKTINELNEIIVIQKNSLDRKDKTYLNVTSKKSEKKIQKKSDNQIAILQSTLLELFIVRTLKNYKILTDDKLIDMVNHIFFIL